MNSLYIALAIWAAIGFIVVALYAFFMSRYNEMRTASQQQIERETAEIEANGESTWNRLAAAIGLVFACLLAAGVLVGYAK